MSRHPPLGRSRGARPDGRRDGVDRRGVAHRRPRAADGLDLSPIPSAARARIAAACRPSATSRTRSTRGAPTTPLRRTGRSRRSPTRARTTSSALVHDFPFRSGRRDELALELAGGARRGDGRSAGVLPVFVSLTSGDATPEIQAPSMRRASRSCAARSRRSGDRASRMVGAPARGAAGRRPVATRLAGPRRRPDPLRATTPARVTPSPRRGSSRPGRPTYAPCPSGNRSTSSVPPG